MCTIVAGALDGPVEGAGGRDFCHCREQRSSRPNRGRGPVALACVDVATPRTLRGVVASMAPKELFLRNLNAMIPLQSPLGVTGGGVCSRVRCG